MYRSAARGHRSQSKRVISGDPDRPNGTPLPPSVRGRMEDRFHANFADIRILAPEQTGANQAARAWTTGNEITFANGEFRPGTLAGDALLAHELAHVVQQRGSAASASAAGADALTLERQAENAAATVVTDQAMPDISRSAGRRVQREERKGDLSVVPELGETDKARQWFDPEEKVRRPVWTPEQGYVKNPSARELPSLVRNGKIAEGFENGQFMYVIDKEGTAWLGKRLQEPGKTPGRATGLPHPTLIGGKNPIVIAAGEVEIRGGRIFKIDNQSGHFQPGRTTLSTSAKAFLKLPTTAFHKDFGMESVHFDPAGVASVKPFRSIQMLKLGLRDLKGALKALKPQAIRGRLRSPAFRGRLRSAAGGIAALLVMIAIQLGLARLQEKMNEKFIMRQIDELAPQVEAALAEKGGELDQLLEQDSDADIYVNVQFDIMMVTAPMVDPGAGAEPGAAPIDMVDLPPVVRLGPVGYSRVPWDPKPVETFEHSCMGSSSTTTRVTASEAFAPKDLFGIDPQDAGSPSGRESTP